MLKSTDKINVSQMLNSAINFNQFRNISATSPLHLRFTSASSPLQNLKKITIFVAQIPGVPPGHASLEGFANLNNYYYGY